jgi:hypothetical protein
VWSTRTPHTLAVRKPENMDDTPVIEELRFLVKHHGSQKEAARELGISEQYLSDLLLGRRSVSEEIAGKVGYRAIWVAHSGFLTLLAPDGLQAGQKCLCPSDGIYPGYPVHGSRRR